MEAPAPHQAGDTELVGKLGTPPRRVRHARQSTRTLPEDRSASLLASPTPNRHDDLSMSVGKRNPNIPSPQRLRDTGATNSWGRGSSGQQECPGTARAASGYRARAVRRDQVAEGMRVGGPTCMQGIVEGVAHEYVSVKGRAHGHARKLGN